MLKSLRCALVRHNRVTSHLCDSDILCQKAPKPPHHTRSVLSAAPPIWLRLELKVFIDLFIFGFLRWIFCSSLSRFFAVERRLSCRGRRVWQPAPSQVHPARRKKNNEAAPVLLQPATAQESLLDQGNTVHAHVLSRKKRSKHIFFSSILFACMFWFFRAPQS